MIESGADPSSARTSSRAVDGGSGHDWIDGGPDGLNRLFGAGDRDRCTPDDVPGATMLRDVSCELPNPGDRNIDVTIFNW